MKLCFFPVCVLYVFSVFFTTSPLSQKQHVLLVACGRDHRKGPIKESAWLIPAKLCAMPQFSHLPSEGTQVWVSHLLHQCWFLRDQKFHQYVCTTCPNVWLNWNRLMFIAMTNNHCDHKVSSLFSPGKQRQQSCLSHLPVLLQMWTDSVLLIALSINLCLVLPFLLCLQTSYPCLLSSALPDLKIFFMLHLWPWDRGGGMHKDFWSPPGMAPGFCNHWLFRRAGQIKSNLLS